MSTKTKTITIGTRGSQLARWQAEWVKSELLQRFPRLTVRLDIIKTTGDKILDSPLSTIGEKGLFTKEIESALLDERVDLAVHSLKDLPTILPAGLIIGAIPKREDAREAFIAHPRKQYKKFNDVPAQGKIATGSLRRKCQLLHMEPGLNIIDLRGNLNTRFAKLDGSDWDGMILARAGVVRLGLERQITEVFSTETIVPAVGQGALGIEIREDAAWIRPYLAPLISNATTWAATAERAFLHALEGGCQIPIGAHARIENNELHMNGLIGRLDGTKLIRGKVRGTPEEAQRLGEQLAATLLESGGREILDGIRKSSDTHRP